MATEGGQTAIRKKLQSARQQATPVAARLGAVWGEAVPKVTEDVLGLEAMVGRVGVTVRSLTRTLEDVPETSLMVRLERPDGEGFGLAIAEATLLAAIIEAQTGGRVRKGPVPERRPTATDAMMLADLLDPWLVAADAGLLDHPGFEDVTGYRTGGYLVDARTVLMSLPEGDYKLAEIALDFQTGTRVGGLKLLFPPCDAPQGIEEEEKSLGEALSDAVMDAPARIEAVLCTTKRSLGQITAFQPGDVLKVPLSSLMAVQLRSPDGRRLSSARLGQLNGQRAVRVQLAAPAGQGVEALAAAWRTGDSSELAIHGDAGDPATKRLASEARRRFRPFSVLALCSPKYIGMWC